MLNYIGPNNGEGIRLYYDGEQVTRDTTRRTLSRRIAATGRIVLGRFYINSNERYSSVTIDEPVIFNRSLKTTEVHQIFSRV